MRPLHHEKLAGFSLGIKQPELESGYSTYRQRLECEGESKGDLTFLSRDVWAGCIGKLVCNGHVFSVLFGAAPFNAALERAVHLCMILL
jgi:hypothetical protein